MYNYVWIVINKCLYTAYAYNSMCTSLNWYCLELVQPRSSATLTPVSVSWSCSCTTSRRFHDLGVMLDAKTDSEATNDRVDTWLSSLSVETLCEPRCIVRQCTVVWSTLVNYFVCRTLLPIFSWCCRFVLSPGCTGSTTLVASYAELDLNLLYGCTWCSPTSALDISATMFLTLTVRLLVVGWDHHLHVLVFQGQGPNSIGTISCSLFLMPIPSPCFKLRLKTDFTLLFFMGPTYTKPD